jgi:hypothetical protein
MMARSFFILSHGLPTPQNFQFRAVPLLAQQNLWEAARVSQPSLLFRVRSIDGAPLSPFKGSDRLESCVGMVDAGTRWRSVFRMAGVALAGISNTDLSKVCAEAIQFVSSQHPANVTAATRRAMVDAIAAAAQAEGTNGFEQRVAAGIAQLAQADNDIEAAHAVPFFAAFMPFKDGTEEQIARVATIETVAGATLIAEAAMRLAERAPYWMYAQMPSTPPVAAEPARQGPREDDQEDADDGDQDPPDGL